MYVFEFKRLEPCGVYDGEVVEKDKCSKAAKGSEG
jgi:hypothetical protein